LSQAGKLVETLPQGFFLAETASDHGGLRGVWRREQVGEGFGKGDRGNGFGQSVA